MRTRSIIAASLLFALIFLSGCNTPPLVYDQKQSTMIGDFSVGNGIATVWCSITVINKSDLPVSFKMKGDFAEDQAVGLFKDRYIYASSGNTFSIGANSTQEYEVGFSGQSGGKELKNDRNPPNNIVFEIQNEE